MINRRKKLDAFVSFELRAMSKGLPNTEKLRFLPLGFHQCLQRWLGIYNLFFDMDLQMPKSLKKTGDKFVGNLKVFWEEGIASMNPRWLCPMNFSMKWNTGIPFHSVDPIMLLEGDIQL